MAINSNCALIAVVGGKGGVGKSVFAANLTIALTSELRTPVLLVDCDTKSVGDQNIITGLKPVKTLRELATTTQSLNTTPLQQLVSQHPAGFSYLGAVRGPEEILSVNPENLSKLIEFFSRSFKFIVVDCGNDLGPMQQAILQDATAIALVSTPEILVVQQTQRMINELMTQSIPKEMIQLVLNKIGPNGLQPQAISQHLGLMPMAMIPSDDNTAMASVSQSKPFVLVNPKIPISNAYFEFVRKLSGGTLQRLKSLQKPKPTPAPSQQKSEQDAVQIAKGMDPWIVTKLRVHSELIRTIDLKKLLAEAGDSESKEKELRSKTQRDISQIVDKEAPDLAREERQKLTKEVLEEALGLG
ncbi:MAG: CpaE family protein, partial [Pseudobdellovibrio sp.]